MAVSTSGAVISGRPYPVQLVGGRAPGSLADFVGATEFTIDADTPGRSVPGVGAERDGQVRFHEKDSGPDGKDVRVWVIRRTADGRYLAEHAPAF